MKPLSMDGNGDVQRYHVKYSHGVRQRNNSLFLVPDFSTKSIERSVDSRKGRYKLKGYNSDDSCFLPPPLSARRSEQFIIIVHELEQRPRVLRVHREARAYVRGRYVSLTSSLFLLAEGSLSFSTNLPFLPPSISRHGPPYISVAICNDRRRHLHSTLHVPSVYSRKTCKPRRPKHLHSNSFLGRNASGRGMQTSPTIDPRRTSLRK